MILSELVLIAPCQTAEQVIVLIVNTFVVFLVCKIYYWEKHVFLYFVNNCISPFLNHFHHFVWVLQLLVSPLGLYLFWAVVYLLHQFCYVEAVDVIQVLRKDFWYFWFAPGFSDSDRFWKVLLFSYVFYYLWVIGFYLLRSLAYGLFGHFCRLV